jgi:hypothetical protein
VRFSSFKVCYLALCVLLLDNYMHAWSSTMQLFSSGKTL